MGIARGYFYRLLFFGIFGACLLFILAGLLAAEGVSAAAENPPLSAAGSQYLYYVLASFGFGVLSSVVD